MVKKQTARTPGSAGEKVKTSFEAATEPVYAGNNTQNISAPGRDPLHREQRAPWVRPRELRVALYSHDTMGLGHIRRNLLIAQTLATGHLQADVLIVTGAPEAGCFLTPPGVDCLVLPSLYKGLDGQYRSRRLAITLGQLIAVRQQTLHASISAFEPDVLIVDTVPRGALGELDHTLEYMRTRGHTRCVLGLRDVRDEPAVVRHEWCQNNNTVTIQSYYDQIWVYGDAAVYDSVRQDGYPPDVADKIRYIGYLDQRARLELASQNATEFYDNLGLPRGPFVLCMVGGGQDGAHLAEAFIGAEPPGELTRVILTGPYMEPEIQRHLRRRAAGNPRLRVLDFVPEPTALVQRADCVIAMGGYNTIAEILSFGKHALIVPRVMPRIEQLIRAQRFSDLGLLDMLHPDELDERKITNWLQSKIKQPPQEVQTRIDMNGLTRLPHLLEALLANPTPAMPTPRIQKEA